MIQIFSSVFVFLLVVNEFPKSVRREIWGKALVPMMIIMMKMVILVMLSGWLGLRR